MPIQESFQNKKKSFSDALEVVKQTYDEVKKVKEELRGKIDAKIIDEIDKGEKTLEKMIPSMAKILSSIDDIRSEVLDPVTQALKESSSKTIFEIQDSAQKTKKWNYFSIVLAIIGLIAGLFFFLAGREITFQDLFKKKESTVEIQAPGPIVPTKEDTYIKLIARIDEHIKGDIFSDKILFFKNIIILALNKFNDSSIYNYLNEEYEKLIREISSTQINLSDSKIFDIAILRFYLESIKYTYFSEAVQLNDLITKIDSCINKGVSQPQEDELKWIKAELYRLSKQYDESIIIYRELNEKSKNVKVIDMLSKKQDNITKVSEGRIKQVSIEKGKNLSRLFLVNSSVSKISGLAKIAKENLIKKGFLEKNIIVENDPDSTSIVYAYFKWDLSKEILLEVLKVLYPNNSQNSFDITSFDKKILNQWVYRELFIKQKADIVIRMPDPK
jgi:hypothetical protein